MYTVNFLLEDDKYETSRSYTKGFCVTASVEAKCYRFREKMRNIFWFD